MKKNENEKQQASRQKHVDHVHDDQRWLKWNENQKVKKVNHLRNL